MANKRELKQKINLICDELYIDLIAASLYGDTRDERTFSNILSAIHKLQDNALSRISHPEPGLKAHKYFCDVKAQFKAQALEMAEQINNL